MPKYEEAKSDRSTCVDCKRKIAKGHLRYATRNPRTKFYSAFWHHKDCAAARRAEMAAVNGTNGTNGTTRAPASQSARTTGHAARQSQTMKARGTPPQHPQPLSGPPKVVKVPMVGGLINFPPPYGVHGNMTMEDKLAHRHEHEALLSVHAMEIVGLKYYEGVLHAGEMGVLYREKDNMYDRNAIAVRNYANAQVGHLGKTFADCLVSIVDSDKWYAPRIEVTIPHSSEGRVSAVVHVRIWGYTQHRDILLNYMKSKNQPPRTGWADPTGTGQNRTNPATANGPHDGLSTTDATVTDYTDQKHLDDLFDKLVSDTAAITLRSLENAFNRQTICTKMYHHQELGLSWMIQRERSPNAKGLPPPWEARTERGQHVFFNSITMSSYPQPPISVRGGLLADDMGLGKTIQIIGLLLANSPPTFAEYVQPVPGLDRVVARICNTLKVPEIRALINSRKLDGNGNKPELLARLIDDIVDKVKREGVTGAPDLGPLRRRVKKVLKDAQDGTNTHARDLTPTDTHATLTSPGGQQSIETYMQQPPHINDSPNNTNNTHGEESSHSPAVGQREADRVPQIISKTPFTKCGERKTTLIVCPASVVNNWQTQLATHIHPSIVKRLKVYTYHGNDRMRDVENLKRFDIIITTYATLAADLKHLPDAQDGRTSNNKRPLSSTAVYGGPLQMPLLRVVLDEAHQIRNTNTKLAKACLKLDSIYRWCLTGTPIQNRADDTMSLFMFLQSQPLNDPRVFQTAIIQPLRAGDTQALAQLRVCMKSFTLRRTKQLLGTLLPNRQVQLVKVKMDHDHAKVYHTLYASAKMIFDQIARLGDDVVSKNYTSVLETILRLRQCCDSPSLIPQDRLQKAKELLGILKHNKDKEHVLTADEAAGLMAKLKQALYSTTHTPTDNGTPTAYDSEMPLECCICMRDFDGDSVAHIIRGCGHVFCQDCLRRLCPSKSALCPVCRRPFQKSDVVDRHHLNDALESAHTPQTNGAIDLSQDDDDLAQHLDAAPTVTDPKTAALIALVNALPSDEKMVVFSQFTKYLDVVEEALLDSGIEPMRFDGQTRMAHRGEMIKKFNTQQTAKVILISLHAGGTGINLTRANHVCLLDLWWNPAVEEQAMDRVYRIGQTRDVRVLRFVLEDSIEEKILDLQETKRVLSTGALNKLSAEETRKLLVTQLRSLFSAEAKIIAD